jgi:prepilin-type N-terminal cleavage/methylation domain-containing protein
MTNSTPTFMRRGVTLIEMLVGMVIFAIIGALCTKLITVQGRFFDRQGMSNAARNVSRAALNRVISDFRMIEANGGVLAASPTSLTIRIPFAIGVVCANNAAGNATVVSLLPVDSTTYKNAGYYGYAWRNFQTGAYSYVENPSTEADGDAAVAAVCTGVNLTTVPPGKVVSLTPVLPALAGLGAPVFLYARVRYDLMASAAVPGKIGLYRTQIAPNGAQSTEELVAPFANTAKWRFFVVSNSTTAQDAAPAQLSTLRGLELHLDGISEYVAAGVASNESAPFTTAVFFKNRTN